MEMQQQYPQSKEVRQLPKKRMSVKAIIKNAAGTESKVSITQNQQNGSTTGEVIEPIQKNELKPEGQGDKEAIQGSAESDSGVGAKGVRCRFKWR